MTARPILVADAAIAHLDLAFGAVAELRPVRGDALSRDHLQGASALLVRSVTRVDRELLDGTPVRFVGSATAGIDHVDLAALAEAGITFAHAPGCNAQAVVEYVLSATLGHTQLVGPVGVVGYGAIGRRLTAALRRLGVDVWVNDPPLEASGTSPEPFRPLSELLRHCRTVTFHVPRVPSGPHATRHLLDADGFALLREGALIINSSRGDVVDNASLQTWLQRERGRAVLDVWEGEPSLRWSLLDSRGLVLATPHIAGYTIEGKVRATAMMHRAYCNAMKLDDSDAQFDPTCVLGAPGSADLRATGPGLAEGLRAAHPLAATDAQLRALRDLPAADRSRGFEALRRRYPLRRELSHYRPTTPGLWKQVCA